MERRVIAELSRTRPELVALVSRDVGEYGSLGFGIDYGRELSDWIRRHYAPERAFGARDRWEILLLRRRDAPG